jgi:hypothetical protein
MPDNFTQARFPFQELDKASQFFEWPEAGTGTAYAEGNFTLHCVKVKCVADIELGMLS